MGKNEIICPTCQKQSTYSLSNASRPFCSERCKLIDLGAWANEEYRVPYHEAVPTHHDDDTENQ